MTACTLDHFKMESFNSAGEHSLSSLKSVRITDGNSRIRWRSTKNENINLLNTADSHFETSLKSVQTKTETDEPDHVNQEQNMHTTVKTKPEKHIQIHSQEITRHNGNLGNSTRNTLQTELVSGFAEFQNETDKELNDCSALRKRSGLQIDGILSEGLNPKTRCEIDLDEKPFICKDSGKHLRSSEVTERQKGIHTGEKSYSCRLYSCPDCGKIFRKSGNLKRHQLIHQRTHPKVNTGQEPYSCSDCGKSFCHLGNLKQHLLTHTDESYSCTVCGKIFFRLGTLERHQLLHTGERLYTCSECGKSFTHLGSLHTHQRIHKGGKTYICTECGQRFYRLGSFKEHQRIHTVEKEYTCIICGDSFNHLGHFKQHEQVHTKETLLMP
ncbi:zinc finger protein 41-like [Anguilla rostrata]|uniref:zinc finger protein 41-like n=1 Tax=Anguilla rostrata TaxID=7938 RepID=UPI0030D051D5